MLGTLVPLSIFATWVMVVELYTVPKLLTVFLIDPVDFHIYRLAGEALNHGRSLYSGDFLPGLPFTYPPFAGTLFRVLPLIGPLEGHEEHEDEVDLPIEEAAVDGIEAE